MITVNYLILGEIFSLLERIELIQGIQFAQFDPDDTDDVRQLVREFIEPAVRCAYPENRLKILYALAYYTTFDTAPLQSMRDSCQELSLCDSDSWKQFFEQVGRLLFGEDFKKGLNLNAATELLDQRESDTILKVMS